MNGIYRVGFRTRIGEGTGTIYLVNGNIYGGDAVVAYWGTYRVEGNRFIATISTKQHSYGLSVLGEVKELKIEILVNKDNIINGTILIPGIAEQLDIQLMKIADL